VRAAHACGFIECLPHVEGKWTNPDGTPQTTIVLHESDVFFIAQLFGFRKPDGRRRFTTALKACARKNAKSTLAAGIGLYCQACEDELGPQIISGATTGSQARVIFNIAKRMVDMTSGLRTSFGMDAFANAVTSYSNGGCFKPINAKASTQDGLNPSVVLLDEIHAHKTHDLLNVLRSAAGARANPLFLFTTTEGYENAGPWPELRQFAMQVLDGVIEADHFLAVYYAVDEEDKEAGIPADDDFDESAWFKANPLMDTNPILLTELRKEAIEAKSMPGRHAEFKVKRLNRPSAAAGGWINLTKWRQCAGPVDLERLRPYPCWGGLDLASVGDFSSFRLVWKVEEHWYTHGWRFVPNAAVHRRTERGLVPYQHWVQSGHLIVAGDDVTDYDIVQETIIGINDRFDIKSIGYDRWNAAQLVKKLEDAGVPLQEFIQGPRSFHPAMQALERAYTSGRLSHGNDPVLNWCAANLVARTDVNMNTAPDKKRAPEKIDDMVALLEAFGVAQSAVTTPPTFQMLFV
jgi:phage terminase large subunit-like protein